MCGYYILIQDYYVDFLITSKNYLPGHIFFSSFLKSTYKPTATTLPVYIPMSPVPAFAIGPVYHVCDMLGIMMPNAPMNDKTAAMPGGRSFAWSQWAILYASNDFRNTKCSVRTMAANAVDQYPIMPQ